MKTILLDFCDFEPGFCKTDNFFYNLLSRHYDVQIWDKPDFIIYSDKGHMHRLHSCVRIYYTGECWRPDFSVCDYAFSFFRLRNERHFRLPTYVLHTDPQTLFREHAEADSILSHKTKFCAFVVGYDDKTVRKRSDFFERLSKYKRVDSGGRGLNNIGGPIPPGFAAKLDFLKPYKFHICFENNSVPGYTTEKLVHAMQARCLPIYWGDPDVNLDFNPKSFLNLLDFHSEQALVDKIIELDHDDEKYLEFHRQPYYNSDLDNPLLHPESLLSFFDRIFSERLHPVASRHRLFSFGRWTLAKRNKSS